MRIALFLLLLLFASGCQPLSPETRESYRMMSSFAAVQKEKNQLELSGIGISIPDVIKGFSLDFDSHQRLDIPQARSLYLSCSQEFLDMINQSEFLRPYLHHYPFTIHDIRLGISFCDNQTLFFGPPYVAYVIALKGNIHYMTFDPETQRMAKEEYKEPYEKNNDRKL